MKLKYPLYSENSTLDMVKVRTIDGEVEYKVNTKMFDGEHYVKNKHLEIKEISGKRVWVKKQDLFYDWETKKYTDSKAGLVNGLVSVDEDGTLKLGFFTPNIYKNCTIVTREYGNIICVDYNIALTKHFVEDLSKGVFYQRSILSNADIQILSKKKLSINNSGNVYNVVDDRRMFERVMDIYSKSEIEIDSDIKMVSRYIDGFKFGVEYETINGTIPEYVKNKYGIIICKDGSLRNRDGHYPPEYVTVPYSGAKGLQSIRNVSKEITKRSDIDFKCSLHVHTEVEMDRIFLVSLYKLAYKIQGDIYKMFPFYKTNERKYANKEKNYCQKLPNIMLNYDGKDFDEYIACSFENLYAFLTGGLTFDRNNQFRRMDNPWGGNKWDIKSRYYWLNFTNLVFGKQPTAEFRIHTPTTNPDKVINWLLICNAILLYAKIKSKDCLSSKKIKLLDVLNIYKDQRNSEYAKKLSSNLIDYYNHRVEYFKADYDKGDYLSEKELKEDETFSFNCIKI